MHACNMISTSIINLESPSVLESHAELDVPYNRHHTSDFERQKHVESLPSFSMAFTVHSGSFGFLLNIETFTWSRWSCGDSFAFLLEDTISTDRKSLDMLSFFCIECGSPCVPGIVHNLLSE